MMLLRFVIFLLVAVFAFSCNQQKEQASQQKTVDSLSVLTTNVLANTLDEKGESLNFFNPSGVVGNGVVNIEQYIEVDGAEALLFDTVHIYNDAECKDLFSSYLAANAYAPPKGKNILPIYNSSDYGWYCFVWTDQTPTSYQVAINKADRKYIKKARNVKSYTWEKFFNSVFTVNVGDENPLREKPSDDAPAIDVFENLDVDNPENYYQEVELHDEWLHIKYNKTGVEGWLRWRKGDQVIATVSISW